MVAKFLILSLLLPISVWAGLHSNSLLNRRHDLAKRSIGTVGLWKRLQANGAKMTFYNAETGNAGSCGSLILNSDFIVAVNLIQMDPSLCYQKIQITYAGKTATATVADSCPACPMGGLDLTEGLFSFFAPHSVGVIYGDWEIGNPAPAQPTITTHTLPPTTTQHTTHYTTSTPVFNSPTIFSKSSLSTKSAPSSKSESSAHPTSSSIPTPTDSGSNLANLYQAIIQVGGVAEAGAHI
jgi:hypothetical protein